MRFRGEVVVVAPIGRTWAALADIASHVEWMADADLITFTTEQRRGAGTTFECRTKVGPFTTLDRMTVTEWVEGTRMTVAHSGVVSGIGVFELEPEGADVTRVAWSEDLRFPWWAAGRLGAFAAKPILRRIWRGNLSRFKGQVEAVYRKK